MVRHNVGPSSRRRARRRPRSQSVATASATTAAASAAAGTHGSFLPHNIRPATLTAASRHSRSVSHTPSTLPRKHTPATFDSARVSLEAFPSREDTEKPAVYPENLTFLSSPFKVTYYSLLYLNRQLANTIGYIVQYPMTLAYSVALVSIYTALHFAPGPHIGTFKRMDAWVAWHSYWILLGVLSSIGLGAGLHTFVLFLGPHIARVTMTAYECGHTTFAVYGRSAFQCSSVVPTGSEAAGSVLFSAILHKVILESLCWGAGTAIGELPPYFIARAASAAGQGDVEYQRLQRRAASGSSLSVKDRALLSVYNLLRRFGFAGILVFAAIPNPLFDLAGITCGHFRVPFWTFFGATFIGKSIIKSTIQTAVVITAFSKEIITIVLSGLGHISPWAHDLAENVLRRQAAAFARGGSAETAGPSSSTIAAGISSGVGAGSDAVEDTSPLTLIGSVWNACVFIMLLYFAISTLESFAQSYLAEVKTWGQSQLARVGTHSRTATAELDTKEIESISTSTSYSTSERAD